MRKVSVWIGSLLILILGTYANAEVVYHFEGQCDGGCTGTATGVLTLEDTYTPGTPLQNVDFISLFYESSTGSFTFYETTFFEFQLIAGQPDRGILPAISGPALSGVVSSSLTIATINLERCASYLKVYV